MCPSDRFKYMCYFRKIYENLIQTTGDQIIAVSMEILYRFLLTVVGIIVIPRLPIVRSFYLNRVYFWAKSESSISQELELQ